MDINKKQEMLQKLELLYGEKAERVFCDVSGLIEKYKENTRINPWVNESDVMLITYGDSICKDGEKPLYSLNKFLNNYAKDTLSAVHLLPMFPYTSDDGFSVVDYKAINEELGSWEDVNELSKNYNLMFDAVINHISKSSEWFKGWLTGDERYKDYFIECDEKLDYSQVTRPRALPLLTPFETSEGKKYVWTTFSDDQIDINFENPKVLVEVLDILITYALNGARFIRFDAIGFAWKKLGTNCMHLPETHALVQLMRDILDTCVPGTTIITETNVPHKDNISYFGNGHNEAQMVYQFPLPPLTLFSFLTGDATKLSNWAADIENMSDETTYFNFLASHDGIGMRPVEDILTTEEKQVMVDNVLANGGKINYKNNPDGSKSPYELNINYQDALTHKDAPASERINKFIASQTILLSVIGMPGIYIHSFLGSRNWYEGVESSGINRRINREKLDYDKLVEELEGDRKEIFERYSRLIKIRRNEAAFSPTSTQKVLLLDKRVFSIIRENQETGEKILVLINVSNEKVKLDTSIKGRSIINVKGFSDEVELEPYEVEWIKF